MVQNLRQMTHSMFLPFPFIIEHPKELKSCLQNSLDIVTYLQATLALTSCNFTLYEAWTAHICKSRNFSHSLKKVDILSPTSCSSHPQYTTLDPPKQAFCSSVCYSISSVSLFSFSLSICLSIFLSKSGYCINHFIDYFTLFSMLGYRSKKERKIERKKERKKERMKERKRERKKEGERKKE